MGCRDLARLGAALLCATVLTAGRGRETAATVVLVVGADGTPEFGEQFAAWAERWVLAAQRGGAELLRVGPGAEYGAEHDGEEDRERLHDVLAGLEPGGDRPLWFVYVGHGTFDGGTTKLNLRGADVSAKELAQWLEPVKRPTAALFCASCTGPFVNHLSRPDRVVVTAARSGAEYSFSRFGDYLSSAVVDPAADLDKDGQVSLLEAFLFASAGVTEFYEGAARLASEHALLDDNGDGLGTSASWFRGVRATREPAAGSLADGVRAHQLHLVPSESELAIPLELRTQRDALELDVEALRRQKETMTEEAYYARLEELFVALARLYESAEGNER